MLSKNPGPACCLACQLATVALLLTLRPAIAAAQTNSNGAVVCGAVERPLALTLADLQAMPRMQLKVAEKGSGEATFEGVALYDVVMRAKPKLTERCCSNAANTAIVIRAPDNYQVIFSMPELDPKFSSRKILLADRREGQPLGPANGPLQLIVPDDRVHGRWVRQVNFIEVLPIGDRGAAATNSVPRQAGGLDESGKPQNNRNTGK
jgi:DMSO/TMAO reductase YedYZ molybdopterin-dependent catalytic subunit